MWSSFEFLSFSCYRGYEGVEGEKVRKDEEEDGVTGDIADRSGEAEFKLRSRSKKL